MNFKDIIYEKTRAAFVTINRPKALNAFRVVPPDELDSEVKRWCGEPLSKSPTALKLAKYSFNSGTDGLFGISSMGKASLDLFNTTAEAAEGTDAFVEKRPPDFSPYRK